MLVVLAYDRTRAVDLVRYRGMLDPEIREYTAGPGHRVLDQLRVPNLNLSTVLFSGTGQL